VDATTRRARLRRFPFALYYEIEDERILILAVWHHRRDPRMWRREG
jgi:plasmid stabilization system protein ParE